MIRLSVLDCDIILWIVAYFNKERNHTGAMLEYLDSMITDILVHTKADKYCGFVQGVDLSHRHKMFPDYKGNRPPTPDWVVAVKPIIKDHMVNAWGIEYAEGQETDDAIASVVEVCKGTDTIAIVCSSDKDFNQLATEIYNPKYKDITIIDEATAEYNLAKQIMTGDMTDNIRGIKGMGPKTAEKLLHEGRALYGQSHMETVLIAYRNHYEGIQGLIEAAYSTIKVTLKRDKNFIFKQIDVPEQVRLRQDPQKYLDQLI